MAYIECDDFWVHLAHLLGIEIDFSTISKEYFASSNAVYVSNHPTGLIDGIAIAALLCELKIDFKIVINDKLLNAWNCTHFSENNFIGLDLCGRKTCARNSAAIRDTANWLKSGGNIILFPSGRIGQRKWNMRSIEPEYWTRICDIFVKKSMSSIVPLYIDLQPSKIFSLASIASKRLRYSLIYRELLIQSRKTIKIEAGRSAILNCNEVSDLDSPLEGVLDA